MNEPKIYFNCSLPRSGSTLLQNILAQNPRFYCSPTSGVLNLLLSARATFSTLPNFKAQDQEVMRDGFLRFCASGLDGFYRGVTDKPVCVDKNRAWLHFYDWLAAFCPKPKILVCVRDLRAILSSMEKLFRKNRHLEDPLDAAGLQMTTLSNRLTCWLNSNPVGPAVLQLLEATQTGVIKNVHVVRFEDLTAHPAAAMKKIYAYLEEEPFEHDFENVEQTTQEDDSQYLIYGDHKIRQRVVPVKPDYNEVLGRELCEQLKADSGAFYKAFYPEKL